MNEIEAMALEISNLIDDKKGLDITLLDVQGVCNIADYFVIASGNSDRQVMAIADHIEETFSKKGIRPKCIEGYRTGRWIVLDYVDVIVHVFHPEERQYYNIERIWNDAKKLKISIDTFSRNH